MKIDCTESYKSLSLVFFYRFSCPRNTNQTFPFCEKFQFTEFTCTPSFKWLASLCFGLWRTSSRLLSFSLSWWVYFLSYWMSTSLSLSLSLCECLSLALLKSLHGSVRMQIYLCVRRSVSVCLSLCMFLSVWKFINRVVCVYLSVCISTTKRWEWLKRA